MSFEEKIAKFEKEFKEYFNEEQLKRVVKCCEKIGEGAVGDITNALYFAINFEKVEEVLAELERYYQENNKNSCSSYENSVVDKGEKYLTKREWLFISICQDILQLPVHK